MLAPAAENWAKAFFPEKIDPKYTFHDLEHTAQVVASARLLGTAFSLSDSELDLLLVAAWFHDSGYFGGPDGHEARSADLCEAFLKEKGASDADVSIARACILATKVPQNPKAILEQILCDADLAHLGMDIYYDRNSRLRQEFAIAQNRIYNEIEWLDFELNFLSAHDYHTVVAREQFNKRKAKHIQQVLKQKRRLQPDKAPSVADLELTDEKEKSDSIGKILRDTEDDLKRDRLGRGVETMFRTTARTHTNLSAMADSKANIMLSVNAIVLSILVTNLLPRLKTEPNLVIPTSLLILTCLGSMIFATLATRPKVTEGRISREDIKARKGNLLFFGNFFNMSLSDFQWGVNELIKDPEYLYNTMSRDLYFLGVVLAKKYRYLSWCYNIFMIGLVVSMLAFAVSFWIGD